MQLHLSLTSPFARLVRMTAIELGLDDHIEQVVIDPWTNDAFRGTNPLAKVPALVTDDDILLVDSPVIAEYLNDRADGALLTDRWPSIRLMSLANGATEAAVKIVVEQRRPELMQSPDWIVRQRRAIDATLDLIEREQVPPVWQIGHIALSATLGYLDFRFPDRDWRAQRPFLADWGRAAFERPAFCATLPPQP